MFLLRLYFLLHPKNKLLVMFFWKLFNLDVSMLLVDITYVLSEKSKLFLWVDLSAALPEKFSMLMVRIIKFDKATDGIMVYVISPRVLLNTTEINLFLHHNKIIDSFPFLSWLSSVSILFSLCIFFWVPPNHLYIVGPGVFYSCLSSF